MARCSECNRFVPYADPPETILQAAEIVEDSVRAEVEVELQCADCTTTLKALTVEAEEFIEHRCPEEGAGSDPDFEEDDEQFELVDDSPEPEGTSRVETKDRHGKEIKNPRYMKTYYGFALDALVHCRKCGDEFTVHLEGEEQASSFEEC